MYLIRCQIIDDPKCKDKKFKLYFIGNLAGEALTVVKLGKQKN